jgi:ribose transport system ATP-binding protein
MKKGIMSVPKERRGEGIVGMLSISDNVAMSSLDKLSSRFGYLPRSKTKSLAAKWIKRLSIRCSSLNDRLNQLSGGNAQKVVFARVMESGCPVIVLNHPTRGVDVGSKEEIYSLIRDITEAGSSVILLGDTLDECIGLSNRIIVLKDGLINGEFECPANNKPSQIDVIQKMM